MIQLQNSAVGFLTYVGETVATDATNRKYFDSRANGTKFNYARVVVQAGPGTAGGTQTLQALKLQESDTTDASNFSDITAFKGGTAFTIPTGSTEATGGAAHILDVDLRDKKRYIGVITQTQDASANALSIHYELSRGDIEVSSGSSDDVDIAEKGTGIHVIG